MSLIDRAFGALQVLKEERLAIGLLLAHSFSIGIFISYYLAYANGAFMGLFEATDLPLTYVLSGVTGFVASAVFARYQKRVAYGKLAMGTLAAIGAVVTAFMVGVWIDPTNKPLIFALFLGLIPVLGLIGLQFGGMIMQLFDLRQGKRLYGVIASGEVVSSMIWFFTIPVILRLGLVPEGQQWMLLAIALAGLGLGMFFQVLLIRRFPAAFSQSPPSAVSRPTQAGKTRKIRLPKLQFDRPYFALVFFLMLFSTLGRVFVDYSFMDAAKATFAGSLTAFFGTFFGLLKVIELITNTFFASRLLNKYGIKLGLLILPTLLAAFAIVALVGHWTVGLEVVFLGLAMNKLFDKTVRTSLELPSFKTLYQPLSDEEKFKLQTQTEGQAGQFGVFLAGGLLMIFIALFPQFKMMEATYFLGLILVGWLLIARRTVQAYRHTVIDKINGLQAQVPYTSPTEMAVSTPPTPSAHLSTELTATLQQAPSTELPYLTAKYFAQLKQPHALLQWLAEYAPQQQYAALLPHLAPTERGRSCFSALRRAPHDHVAFLQRYHQLTAAPTIGSDDHLTLLQLIDLARQTTAASPTPWLLQQAQHPLPTIRQASLLALHHRQYQADNAEERRLIKTLLQQALRHYLYLLATQLDTAAHPDAEWQRALTASLADAHSAIFAHLALLYDATTVFQIQYHLAEGAAQEALAIEMADILLQEDLKEMILPFLDRISAPEKLKRLHWLAPQQRFNAAQRLRHVAQYDYTHGDIWLRYQALQGIAATSSEPPQPLLAHLHHPEPALQEAAWGSIQQHHEATYYRLRAHQHPPQTDFARHYRTLLQQHLPVSAAAHATLAAWVQVSDHPAQPWPTAQALQWPDALWRTLCDVLPGLTTALHTTAPDESAHRSQAPITPVPPLL